MADADSFAFRQFEDVGGKGTVGKICYDKKMFEDKVNEEIDKRGGLDNVLVPGYAPFCKHVFMENFCGALCLDLEITRENQGLLNTSYESRRESELPVLSRYFKASDIGEIPCAKYLDIILYSREQIEIETKAMGEVPNDEESSVPYGIISIKPQNGMSETPMQPITMMRNALGKEHGGSGVVLEREKYMDSVKYWSIHAPIKEN
uniref:Flagellar associated protein n=1 Tax=Mucochytrium quahogii TaxID=96639 RepID=A0A7S2SE29_9STRA|mmetsp:Transcript_24980/g.40535  ORF Transcript_24980/g.40535 Transcript_24980/m.40535 type:complete len:205 (+) Transcript_24980:198-812(+)